MMRPPPPRHARAGGARVVVDDVTATTRRVDEKIREQRPRPLEFGLRRLAQSPLGARGAGLANLTHSKLRNFVRSLAPTLSL